MSQDRDSISSRDTCTRLQGDGPPFLRLEISPQTFGVNILSTTCDNGSFAQLCSFLDVLVECCLLWSRNTLFQFPFLGDMILVLVLTGKSERSAFNACEEDHLMTCVCGRTYAATNPCRSFIICISSDSLRSS